MLKPHRKLLFYHVAITQIISNNLPTFLYSHSNFAKIFIRKVIARLTDHDGVITPLVRGAPRLGLALGPAPARAGPGWMISQARIFAKR